jgi:predicted amidohydrolase
MELRVTLVQTDLVWENRNANLEHISGMLEGPGPTDLILLPEMFSTGFSMNAGNLAEEMAGPTVSWMSNKASELDAVVAGSLMIREKECFFNRFVWAKPDRKVQWYDKKHLFSVGGEERYYTPGKERVTLEWRGWKIRLMICYDLRFPVWSYNHDDYDLLVYAANWPESRQLVWKNLLVARALENQCYCAAVNRLGTDGTGLSHCGDSGLVSPKGDAVWMGNRETIQTFTLSLTELHQFREKFPVLRDRDSFYID